MDWLHTETSGTDHAAKGRTPFVICHALSARRTVAIILASVLTVIASSLVAWDGGVPAWEASMLRWVNGLPDGIEPAMWFVQQPGVLFAPIAAGLVIVASTRQWKYLVPFAMVLPLKLGIEKGLVKQFVERERPFTSTGEWVQVRGTEYEGLSFPSGHTTTAFALGILLSAFLPTRWRFVPLVWALMVGVARLYFGEHNVLDVVAGAAMGTAFATGLWFVFLNRHVHPDCGCAQ